MAYGEPVTADRSLDAAHTALMRGRTSEQGWLYRIDAVSYSQCVDPEREVFVSSPPQLELSAYEVRRWTPHGATLVGMSDHGFRDRWVDLRPERGWQWASRTPGEAVIHFRNRRRAQLQKLERQFNRAREELHLAGETWPRFLIAK